MRYTTSDILSLSAFALLFFSQHASAAAIPIRSPIAVPHANADAINSAAVYGRDQHQHGPGAARCDWNGVEVSPAVMQKRDWAEPAPTWEDRPTAGESQTWGDVQQPAIGYEPPKEKRHAEVQASQNSEPVPIWEDEPATDGSQTWGDVQQPKGKRDAEVRAFQNSEPVPIWEDQPPADGSQTWGGCELTGNWVRTAKGEGERGGPAIRDFGV